MGYERYSRNDTNRDDRQRGSGRDTWSRDGGGRDRYGADAYGAPRDERGYGGDRDYSDASYGDRAPRYRGYQEQDRGAYDQGRYGNRERGQQGYGRQPQGYDYEDRGFFDRAGDEVRSWFGDERANRRRDLDARYDEQRYGVTSDDHYHNWRRSQIDALDRDYDEYRRENRSKFDTEFGTWRSHRQTQRSSLSQVAEHMDVVGSDGAHIGTVDKVRGDRIVLTRNDADAGGKHHSIPSRWIQSVDDKVTISKTADDAKAHWRDEERQAFFGEDDTPRGQQGNDGPHVLGRSFSGTY